MKKIYLSLILLVSVAFISKAQNTSEVSPCSESEILHRLSKNNPNALLENEQNEAFTKAYIEMLAKDPLQKKKKSTYVIPVVFHVFHNGDDGKIDMDQIKSGLDVLNKDYKGFNSDFNNIDPRFDSIKATLDIQFCIATIDPDGKPTTGVNYYQDSLGMLNEGDLFQHAWDNYKYLNIYMPKYTGGSPSLFTAYAYYPNTFNTDNNTDGVFYSSIRWGYGAHSELTPGQEWASVCSHEVGHWLNLRHTFENGCDIYNDLVDDTPPTLGGDIHIAGCHNNDSSCGVPTNGENYMDYNHDCKKMFTRGQVARMTAALQLKSRSNLWSNANLVATGCGFPVSVTETIKSNAINVYPNPAEEVINFRFETNPTSLVIFDVFGNLISAPSITNHSYQLKVNELAKGIYFYQATFDGAITNGKFVVK